MPLVYDHLRDLAAGRMAGERRGHTLQATALVHEAYLRLFPGGAPVLDWKSRGQFYGAAAEAMRRILVDRARERRAGKRGGGRKRVPLDQAEPGLEDESIDLLALDRALDELRQRDERTYDVAMLRHFCGLTTEHTARALGISPRTVRREWSVAQLVLHEALTTGQGDGDG
jgi:RNA polymerase sigma factor (TIGR02999 family)